MTFKELAFFLLFCATTFSGPALCQSNETPPATGTQKGTAAPASAPTGKAAANPATPTDAPAVKAQKFDDWYYRCVTVKSEKGAVDQCEVAQIAQVNEGGKPVNVLTLAFARSMGPVQKDKKPVEGVLLTALVPLNVMLPQGLSLTFTPAAPISLSYRNCNQAGCWAQYFFTDDKLKPITSAKDGQARLQLLNGQNVNIKFSAQGLTKALAQLRKPSSN